LLGKQEMYVTFAPALPHKIVHLNTEKRIKKSLKKTSKKICQKEIKNLSLHPAREKKF
jgi:hypothetical protein